MTRDPDSALLLVVEDEYLLALDLEERLLRLGHRVLGPAFNVREAHALLDQTTPNAGLLDVNLRGDLVTPIAERLAKEGVPYLLITAYSRAASDHPALADVPRLTKPVYDGVLHRAVDALLI